MRITTPYAIGVAAAATWGLSPFWAGVVTMLVLACYAVWRIIKLALGFHGPTVIDPNDPPYKG